MIESQTLIADLGALSYAGIWFVSLCANMIIPVPEEFTLLALGYIAGTGKANIWILIPIVISALLLSDLVIYALSKKSNKFITWIFEKFFAKRFSEKQSIWVDANINKIVFFSRFLIQLRFIGPFMAGQKKIPLKQFVSYTLAALFIYVPVYLLLGLFFHRRVESIIDKAGIVRNSILIFIGLALAFSLGKSIYSFLFKKSFKKQ